MYTNNILEASILVSWEVYVLFKYMIIIKLSLVLEVSRVNKNYSFKYDI